jgi:DNA-directed RNA polymerase specialized sigma24 family protein
MPLNKRILEEYIDACELIRETEEDIRKLEKKQNSIQQDSVQGSNPEFPYQRTHIHIEGILASPVVDERIRKEKKLLELRKANAEKIKLEVQQFMNQTSTRMQRIIRLKYFEGLPWEEVATQMGKRATGDSVRMELERFLQNK